MKLKANVRVVEKGGGLDEQDWVSGSGGRREGRKLIGRQPLHNSCMQLYYYSIN
jgi:hypothetical protein